MQALLASTSLQELFTIDFGELSTTHQLGDTKAAQLQAVVELARRLTLPHDTQRYQVLSPADAANLVRAEMSFLDHEELRVLCLDTNHGVVANIRLYQGTINSSVLKKYQTPEREAHNEYARWLCYVTSPYSPHGDYGDTYITTITEAGAVKLDGNPLIQTSGGQHEASQT